MQEMSCCASPCGSLLAPTTAPMGDSVLHDSMLYDGLHDAFSGDYSGWHTEDLAARYALSREAQDRWAERCSGISRWHRPRDDAPAACHARG